MLLGVQLVVAAFAGLMWGIVIASIDTAVKWWDALAAIGTCLTALLAIVIPWWQNWERDRAMKRAEAPRRLAAAQSATEVADVVRHTMNEWKDKMGPPHVDMLDAMRARLELADSRIDDSDGSAILADLGLVIRALHSQVKATPRAVEAPQTSLAIYLQCDRISQRVQAWKEKVLEDFDILGLKRPPG